MKFLLVGKSIITPLALVALTACSSISEPYTGADSIRNRLSELESSTRLAHMAPMAMEEARVAVFNAEQYTKDPAQSNHLLFIAERRVDIAEVEAQKHYLEEQRRELNSLRDNMLLEARTKESRQASMNANTAKNEAVAAQKIANEAQLKAEIARQELNQAQQKTLQAEDEVKDMQRQLAELKALNTSRGSVVTLGDLLFEFNKSEINSNAVAHLAKLATFLNNNMGRSAIIEGHTDNVGPDDFNLILSQRRADAVKDYLLSQGIDELRLQASGKGALLPVTNNENAANRQQNRRVEVIISQPVS